jgi:Uma2 family endonuclease
MSTAAIHTSGQAPPVPIPTGARTRRLLTAADLALFPKSLPSGDVRWELFDGEPLPMSPPGFGHGKVAFILAGHLWVQGQQKGYGEGSDEAGVILRRNPDRVVGPDLVFVAAKSLPAKLSPEGYLETIPEWVLEVRTVTAHRPNQPPAVVGPADTLTADPVIPGFAVPVAELFRP